MAEQAGKTSFDMSPQTRLLERLMTHGERPRRLYHYTSSEGFLGILASMRIWATDIRYLNDAKEYQYTLDLVQTVLEYRRAKITAAEAPLLDRFTRALDSAPNMRLYVSCFSRLGDALSQWRAYARGGFSLSFDPDLLLAAAVDYPEPTLLLQCVYERGEQESYINHAIDSLLRDFHAAVDAGANEQEMLNAYEVHFFAHAVMLASCFKHPKFEEEKEWRLIVRPRGVEKGAVGRRVRTGNRWLVPYREVPLAAENGTLEIREVVVGPTPHRELATEAARIALDEHHVRYYDVLPSEIPYRDW